ncbi:FKBP-type peptidyl-prolyl cis-trans isomerase [Marinicellulosiphila megalodicopiae]|uniref:FKBP-type peptidyl-prolyl cis-trans isomerase n=1 Tax=Marinicellulosiphila megalodicopiae TaxID=2724896 RepID=UPI003BB036AE
MNIEQNSVVSFHFELKNKAGEVVQSSDKNQPVLYLQGSAGMLPGVVEALLGKKAGDKLELSLTPEQGFGDIQPDAIQRVPAKKCFYKGKAIKGKLPAGTIIDFATEHGPREVTIVKVGLKSIDVDLNHPFAGQELDMSVDIVDVRAATEDEKSHGHAHGAGGHNH